jgi:monoamine oxidase
VPVDVIREERADRRFTRRSFLGGTAVVAGAAAVTNPFGNAAWAGAGAGKKPSVAVVGAGLAGLTCAYRLRQAGVIAKVFEAAPRLGGRCYTRRGFFAENQIVERGGELIDTDHDAIRGLAAELGLVLDDIIAAEPAGTEPVYRFDNQKYTYAQATSDFEGIYDALQNDLNAAGYPTTWDASTPAGAALDKMTVAEYIDRIVPGGHSSPFGKLLDVAYNIEFGAETSDQSALNLLYLLSYSDPNIFQIFGSSDEHYHIRGGNDQVVSLLAASLGDQIQTGSPLVSIRTRPDGRVNLAFGGECEGSSANFDHVVLALPFSILNHVVDYSKAGFDALKVTAITQLGMGASVKFQPQFSTRVWNQLGNNGDTYADTGFQNTWEATRAQPGKAGIIVNFTGGNIARSYNQGSLDDRMRIFLHQIEPVLPGLSGKFNGKVTLDYWPGYEWTRGSYSYWKPGQYTTFAGYEEVRQGNIHFCGEHTSLDSQGYLNGAVATGEDAAAEILADIA